MIKCAIQTISVIINSSIHFLAFFYALLSSTYPLLSTPLDVPLVSDQGKLLKKGVKHMVNLIAKSLTCVNLLKKKYIVLKTIGHFCHRSLYKQVICQQFSAFKLSALIWPSVNEDHRPLSTRQSAFIFIATL